MLCTLSTHCDCRRFGVLITRAGQHPGGTQRLAARAQPPAVAGHMPGGPTVHRSPFTIRRRHSLTRFRARIAPAPGGHGRDPRGPTDCLPCKGKCGKCGSAESEHPCGFPADAKCGTECGSAEFLPPLRPLKCAGLRVSAAFGNCARPGVSVSPGRRRPDAQQQRHRRNRCRQHCRASTAAPPAGFFLVCRRPQQQREEMPATAPHAGRVFGVPFSECTAFRIRSADRSANGMPGRCGRHVVRYRPPGAHGS
jgi:hypothetical protein